MSQRTSEAQKGIRLAWQNEKQRVLEGKGTRDWSPTEQQSIIDIGIAKDENGETYIGHHMKNAEKYPEYQGDPDNIQFLTKDEHFYGAHRGSWRNPSNGYYNPVTKEITDFGDGKYIPCKVIDLSDPVVKIEKVEVTEIPEPPVKDKKEVERNSSPPKDTKINDKSKNTYHAPHKHKVSKMNGVKRIFGKAANFAARHAGDITKVAVVVAPFVIKGVADVVSSSRGGESGNNYSSPVSTTNKSTLGDIASAVADSADKGARSSPKEHMVSGYDRVRFGKVEHINSYPRGGKKS